MALIDKYRDLLNRADLAIDKKAAKLRQSYNQRIAPRPSLSQPRPNLIATARREWNKPRFSPNTRNLIDRGVEKTNFINKAIEPFEEKTTRRLLGSVLEAPAIAMMNDQQRAAYEPVSFGGESLGKDVAGVWKGAANTAGLAYGGGTGTGLATTGVLSAFSGKNALKKLPDNMIKGGFYSAVSNPIIDKVAGGVGAKIGAGGLGKAVASRATRAGVMGSGNVLEDVITSKSMGIDNPLTPKGALTSFGLGAAFGAAGRSVPVDGLGNAAVGRIPKMHPEDAGVLDAAMDVLRNKKVKLDNNSLEPYISQLDTVAERYLKRSEVDKIVAKTKGKDMRQYYIEIGKALQKKAGQVEPDFNFANKTFGMNLSDGVKSGKPKNLEDSLNKTQFKNLDEATKRSVLEEAERMLAGGLGDVGTVKAGDTGFKYSSNPDWYRDFYKQVGKAPTNEEFFDIALSRVKPQESGNIDDIIKSWGDEMATDVPTQRALNEYPTDKIVAQSQEGLSIPRTDMQKFDPNRISSNDILALPGKSTGVAGDTFNIQNLEQPVDRKQGVKLSKQLMKEDQRTALRLRKQSIKDAANTIAKNISENTRSKVQKEVKSSAGVLSNSRAWKDKAKLLLKRETMERNFEDIMGADAPRMKQIYIDPIKKSEADRMRFLNKERSDIAKLGIAPKSKESELLQRFGEKQIDAITLKKQAPESYQKIIDAEKVFREKYDKYLTDINLALTRNGYDPIPKRKDYFRHFNEVGSVLEQFGIPVKDDLIPTDIVGLTADFKPGKNFFASALPRLGKMTEVDAIRGIDKYLDGASNQIYHTDNIQRMRGLERSLRDIHAGTGQLSNFTAELMEYTNKLAGKKSLMDRGAEDLVGRKFYSAANFLKRQTGSNMVGLNVASALTNFIPFTQSLATTSKDAAVKGLAQTMKNVYRNDGFIKKSDFLTSRFGADPLFRTTWENAQDKGFYLMKVADKFVSESIVRGKYLEGLKKGMSDSEAIKYADDYAGKLLANRSKGMMPTIFDSQTLGAFTQFQLEVNNQLSFMFKDLPRMYDKKGTASALAQIFLYSYMFNAAFEKVAGRRPAFDPIGVAIDTYEDYTNEDMKKGQATTNLAKNVANQLPFSSFMTGGRVPLANVLPNPMAVVTGDSTLKKEASDMLFGLVPPTAGNQIRKTLQGVQSYRQGSSKTPSGRVRFPIEQTPANLARTALFGQYSVPEAESYFREGRTPLGEKQTKTFDSSSNKTGYYNKIIGDRGDGSKGIVEPVAAMETQPLPQGEDLKIYYKDLQNSIEGARSKRVSIQNDYQLTAEEKEEKMEELRNDIFEKSKRFKQIQNEQPFEVFKIELEAHSSGDVDKRGDWAMEQISKFAKEGKQDQIPLLLDVLWDNKVLTSGKSGSASYIASKYGVDTTTRTQGAKKAKKIKPKKQISLKKLERITPKVSYREPEQAELSLPTFNPPATLSGNGLGGFRPTANLEKIRRGSLTR